MFSTQYAIFITFLHVTMYSIRKHFLKYAALCNFLLYIPKLRATEILSRRTQLFARSSDSPSWAFLSYSPQNSLRTSKRQPHFQTTGKTSLATRGSALLLHFQAMAWAAVRFLYGFFAELWPNSFTVSFLKVHRCNWSSKGSFVCKSGFPSVTWRYYSFCCLSERAPPFLRVIGEIMPSKVTMAG